MLCGNLHPQSMTQATKKFSTIVDALINLVYNMGCGFRVVMVHTFTHLDISNCLIKIR